MRSRISGTDRSIINISIWSGLLVFSSFWYVILLGQYFGVSREIEIFFAASLFYQLIVRITQTGQLAEIVIPIYHETKAKYGFEAALESYNVVTTWLLTETIILGVLGIIGNKIIVKLLIPGFDQESKLIAMKMIRSLALLPFFQVLFNMVGNLANAERYFGWPVVAAVLGGFVNIIFVIVAHNIYGIWTLVIGLWLSTLVKLVVLTSILQKKMRIYLKFSSPFVNLKVLIKRIVAATIYTGATQLYMMAISASFSYLPSGSYGAFQYAQKFVNRLQSVLVKPIGIVYFTEFSEKIVEKGDIIYKKLLFNSFKKSTIITSLTCITLAIISPSLIKILFGSHIKWGSMDKVIFSFRGLLLLLLIKPISLLYRKLIMAFQKAGQYYSFAAIVQIFSAFCVYLIVPKVGFKNSILVVIGLNLLLLTLPVALVFVQNEYTYYLKHLKYILPVDVIFLLIYVLIYPIADNLTKFKTGVINFALINILIVFPTLIILYLISFFYFRFIAKHL